MMPYRPDMVLECADRGNFYLFDVLVNRTSGPEFNYAREQVKAMCDRCPIRDACHAANDDEDWLKVLTNEASQRTCQHCGNTFTQITHGRPKRYCDTPCRSAAGHVRRKAA